MAAAFTVALDDMSRDDTRVARDVAHRFDTELVEIRLNANEEQEQVVQALAAMDQPSGDGVNTYLIAGAVARQGLKVALSGLGGDELFGGYASFSRVARARRGLGLLKAAPAPIRRAAAAVARAANDSRAEKIATVLEGDADWSSVYTITRQLFTPHQRRALLASDWYAPDQDDPYATATMQLAAAAPDGIAAAVTIAESRTYMHDVLLRDTDQMSMAHGLEVRVPLLDRALAEYVVSLPDEMTRGGVSPKPLLTRSLDGLLPPAVLDLPKTGFVLPFDRWMRGPLATFCEARLRRLSQRGMLRADATLQLWRGYIDGSPATTWSRPWALVALDEWLERNGVS